MKFWHYAEIGYMEEECGYMAEERGYMVKEFVLTPEGRGYIVEM